MSRLNRFRKLIITTAAALLSVILMTVSVAAYPNHTDYISDAAVILDENCENSVKSASAELYKTKNARIALCSVLNTEGKDAKTYASELFTEWKVGHGVLILVVTEDNTFYAVQSRSMQDVLTDAKLSEILNSTMEPSFKEGNYSAGALAAANAISVFLTNNLPEGFGEDEKGGMPTFLKVILIIVGVVVLLIAAGYGALVFLEKRQARRLSEERRMRARRAAQGYGDPYAYPPRPQGTRPAGAYPPAGRPQGAQPRSPRPQPPCHGAGSPQGTYPAGRGAQPRPQAGYSSDPRRGRPADGTTQVIDRVSGRSSQGADKAETIRLNTADIRAAMNARKNGGK